MNKQELINLVREIIAEVTIKDIRGEAPNFLNVRVNSKQMSSEYIGMDDDTVLYRTKSQHGGNFYNQKIKLLDLNALVKKYKKIKKPIVIVRAAIKGNVLIHCDDPSWKFWGFQYKATKDGYALEKEIIPPTVRNPQMRGSICKHLDAALLTLPFNTANITMDLEKQGKFN